VNFYGEIVYDTFVKSSEFVTGNFTIFIINVSLFILISYFTILLFLGIFNFFPDLLLGFVFSFFVFLFCFFLEKKIAALDSRS
jgi:ABC-type transport system involved in multi-copper enzyme maturation permease subunit